MGPALAALLLLAGFVRAMMLKAGQSGSMYLGTYVRTLSRCALNTNVIFTLVIYVLVPIVCRIRSLIANVTRTYVRSRLRTAYVFNVWYEKYGSRRNIR